MSSQNSFFEVLHVNSKKVTCDGGKSSGGHPLVYLNMGDNDSVTCPYCSKCFTVENSSNDKKITNKND